MATTSTEPTARDIASELVSTKWAILEIIEDLAGCAPANATERAGDWAYTTALGDLRDLYGGEELSSDARVWQLKAEIYTSAAEFLVEQAKMSVAFAGDAS